MHEHFALTTENNMSILSQRSNNMAIVSPKQYVMNVKSKSKGVLLDEFLHIIYKLKVYEKFFISLYIFQNPFEYCKVEYKQTILLFEF